MFHLCYILIKTHSHGARLELCMQNRLYISETWVYALFVLPTRSSDLLHVLQCTWPFGKLSSKIVDILLIQVKND